MFDLTGFLQKAILNFLFKVAACDGKQQRFVRSVFRIVKVKSIVNLFIRE